MLDPRAQLLRAALGFSTAPCPRMTESCTRLAHLAGLVGRDRARHRGDAPCFDLQLTQYDEKGWRATFYTTGMEHSPTSATGTAWERTPWQAVQRAARGGAEEGGGGAARWDGTRPFLSRIPPPRSTGSARETGRGPTRVWPVRTD